MPVDPIVAKVPDEFDVVTDTGNEEKPDAEVTGVAVTLRPD